MHEVLAFAPTALAHRMWELARTMKAVAETMAHSARLMDRAETLTARSRRIQRSVGQAARPSVGSARRG